MVQESLLPNNPTGFWLSKRGTADFVHSKFAPDFPFGGNVEVQYHRSSFTVTDPGYRPTLPPDCRLNALPVDVPTPTHPTSCRTGPCARPSEQDSYLTSNLACALFVLWLGYDASPKMQLGFMVLLALRLVISGVIW